MIWRAKKILTNDVNWSGFDMKKIIGQPTQTNTKLIELIKKTKINNYYIKNQEDFRKEFLRR